MDEYIKFAPIILGVVGFLLQHKFFVAPEQLERKHREILEDASCKFATMQIVDDLKDQFKEMKDKIDKIYECVLEEGCRRG